MHDGHSVAKFSTSRMIWVEIGRICLRPAGARLCRKHRRCTSTSSPAVGSSKISTGGSWIEAQRSTPFASSRSQLAPDQSRKSFILRRSKKQVDSFSQLGAALPVQPSHNTPRAPRPSSDRKEPVFGDIKPMSVTNLVRLLDHVETGHPWRCRRSGLSTVQRIRSVVVLSASRWTRSGPNTFTGHGRQTEHGRRHGLGPVWRREMYSLNRDMDHAESRVAKLSIFETATSTRDVNGIRSSIKP